MDSIFWLVIVLGDVIRITFLLGLVIFLMVAIKEVTDQLFDHTQNTNNFEEYHQ